MELAEEEPAPAPETPVVPEPDPALVLLLPSTEPLPLVELVLDGAELPVEGPAIEPHGDVEAGVVELEELLVLELLVVEVVLDELFAVVLGSPPTAGLPAFVQLTAGTPVVIVPVAAAAEDFDTAGFLMVVRTRLAADVEREPLERLTGARSGAAGSASAWRSPRTRSGTPPAWLPIAELVCVGSPEGCSCLPEVDRTCAT